MAKFVLFLTVVPLLELYLLFQVGAQIGFFPTVAFTILTAALGSALARTQALRIWADWQANLSRLESPAQSVLEGLMILVGGVLLLTPGFLTDGLGFLLLLPWTRRFLAAPLRKAVEKHFTAVRIGHARANPFSRHRPDVVDTTAVETTATETWREDSTHRLRSMSDTK